MQDEATAGQGQWGGAASRVDTEGRLRGLDGGQASVLRGGLSPGTDDTPSGTRESVSVC